MAPNKITKSFRSQSQRLQAASDAAGLTRTTPPAGNGLLQSGCPPISSMRPQSGSSRKLNTPTKQPGSSSAQGAAAGVATLMPAQAKGAAGAADPYAFPEDDDDQHQAAVAASHAGRSALGSSVAGPAGFLNPKLKRVKASTDRSRKDLQDRFEHGQQKDQRRVARLLDTQDVLACDSGDENTPACQSLLPFSSSAQPAAAAASKPGALVGGSMQPRQQQQPAGTRKPDIRQFFRKLPASGASDPQPMPAGMLNHGNTCYLNAILQALLSLPCLARDLGQLNCSSSSGDNGGTGGSTSNPGSSGNSASKLQLPPDGVTAAMVTCLRQYQAACSRARGLSDASTAAISPQVVREAMQKRASHWGAARQEDAHEFFTALLNGLADEVQQAQLECIQKVSSTQTRKQAAATAGQLALPSADDAAQACQTDEQVDLAAADGSQPRHQQARRQQQQQEGDLMAAAAMHLPDDDLPHGQQQQQQEEEEEEEPSGIATAAEAAAERGSRPPTPACQLPSMSVSQALCPVTRNFLGCLQHTYTCSVCGKKTVQKEQFNHLILDLPQDDDNSSSGGGSSGLFGSTSTVAGGLFGSISNRAPVADLSSLLANHFSPETCDKACEGCGAAEVQHTVEHAVRRLPRVLVVQLKRFKWVISKDGFPDCRKMPTPVKPDKQLFLGRLCVPGRPVPPLLASLMPPRLIRSAMEAAGEQPPQQQQQLAPLDSTGGAAGRIGGCGAAAAAAGAAAVADGGLDGLLQAGDSCLDTPFDAAAAVGQHSDQQQKQPKRLGGLRPLDDAQTSKKPRTVAASSFGAPTTGSLAGFWHGSDGSTKLKPVLISSRLKAASQQQQQQEGEPDLDAALYADGLLDSDILQGGGCSPRQPLRRNNSSSATPAWDSGQELSGFADAAERELDDDLSRALLLSKQEFEQQQKLSGEGGEGDEDVAVQLPDEMDGDDSFQVPSWIEEQHVPAEAAAPPASPVHAGGPAETPPADFAGELLRQQQQDRQHQRERQQAGAADLYARSPAAAAGAADTAMADGIFAFTPPQGHQQQQAGLGAAMDLDGGAGAGADCAGPSSPALLAPQPDRSGRVSSSTAPGGSQLRPAGQKLGGGAAAAASPASAAAAAAALLRNGNQGVQPKLLKEVQERGLSEEEQLARAIAESMKEQQQQQQHNGPDPANNGPDAAHTTPLVTIDAWLRHQQPSGIAPIAELGTAAAPMEVDGGLDDEDKMLEWALKESAAEHERQQQLQLLKLQQQELIDLSGGDLLAASTLSAATGDTSAAAAAAGADGSVGQGQAGAGAEQEGQKGRKERPPALLLRLLEDSDYEAEQEELRGRSRSSSPSIPGAAEGSNELVGVGISQGGEQQGEQPVQPKRRRGRPRKQQVAAGADGSEAPAPVGAGVKKHGVLRPRDHAGVHAAAEGAAAAGGAADDLLDSAAADPGLQIDKENCCAAGTGGADTDMVPDRPSGRAAAAGAGAKGAAKGGKATQQKQRRALKEILGDSSARNAAAGAAAAAAADPPQKPAGVSTAVAAAQAAAAAAGRQGGAAAAVDEVQELQEGVAAGAVGAWPQDAASSYSLSAVVRHMGEMVSVGHFTSDVLNHEIKRWFHYDDSYVRPQASIEAVRGACQRDGYLFFYVNDAISEN